MTDVERQVARKCGIAYRQALQEAGGDAGKIDDLAVAEAAEELMSAEEIEVWRGMARDPAELDMREIGAAKVTLGALPSSIPGLLAS
jgi:hypothetical protein